MVLEELAGFEAAVGAIQKTIDILNGISKNPKNEAVQKAQQQIIEVQRFVMQSNQQMVTLQKERNELEARVRELENFSEELERYELRILGESVSAYVLKKECRKHNGEEHLLCPDCAAESKTSFLSKGRYDGGYTLTCSRCGEKGNVFEHAPRLPPSPASGYIV